jgi:hypothetical protein
MEQFTIGRAAAIHASNVVANDPTIPGLAEPFKTFRKMGIWFENEPAAISVNVEWSREMYDKFVAVICSDMARELARG